MNLITQVQGVGYSFVFGLVFSFVFCACHLRIVKVKQRLFRLALQSVFGIGTAIFYFYGLLVINEGIITFYFLLALLAGYIVYMIYFSATLMKLIVKIDNVLKLIYRFVIHRINDIMKLVKKVMTWRKKEENQS